MDPAELGNLLAADSSQKLKVRNRKPFWTLATPGLLLAALPRCTPVLMRVSALQAASSFQNTGLAGDDAWTAEIQAWHPGGLSRSRVNTQLILRGKAPCQNSLRVWPSLSASSQDLFFQKQILDPSQALTSQLRRAAKSVYLCLTERRGEVTTDLVV